MSVYHQMGYSNGTAAVPPGLYYPPPTNGASWTKLLIEGTTVVFTVVGAVTGVYMCVVKLKKSRAAKRAAGHGHRHDEAGHGAHEERVHVEVAHGHMSYRQEDNPITPTLEVATELVGNDAMAAAAIGAPTHS
ncbi:hypothetical protein T440DRAFT_477813 [Plenodomus tracheiphilus IPT5]|uniref:Uncharacterized protein n=1 Tax=Plenodomus tracheiphilus IPT5 TaxID=1408161 RepID=A0A6A7BDB6_9PLEO|nr:hypothetical protein T440DRAFT_477813 [Plenodomus tracheiphilus IPT5]